MPKYEICETRQVIYTVDVPDGVHMDDLAAARPDSRNFEARGSGEPCIADSSELVSYTVKPAIADDDEPADVQLDESLRDRWADDAPRTDRPHSVRVPVQHRAQHVVE